MSSRLLPPKPLQRSVCSCASVGMLRRRARTLLIGTVVGGTAYVAYKYRERPSEDLSYHEKMVREVHLCLVSCGSERSSTFVTMM